MKIKVLDCGYVKLVETWGSDQSIVEAARMSTQKGFQGWGVEEECDNCQGTGREPGFGSNHNCRTCGGDFAKHKGRRINKPGDEKLLKYLWTNRHDTPFEFAGMIVEVKAPIFVFREWHRHRAFGFNEMSARYEPLPDENYIPTVERIMRGGGHLTKQAGSVKDGLTPDFAEGFRIELKVHYEMAEQAYQNALHRGVPKELARLVLPAGRYSRMRATCNLRMWYHFLGLRNASNAQWEIQEFARACLTLLQEKFPRCTSLFEEVTRK